jgi:hypothetical protein
LVVKYNRRITAEMKIIEEMLMSYNTDVEIINILKIPVATFYRYKSRIYQDCASRFNEKRITDTGFYTEQLNTRLTKYLKIFESKLDECNTRDIVGVGQLVVETAKTIFDLNLQGLEILDTVRSLDKKIQTYEVSHGGSSSNNNGSTNVNNNSIVYKPTTDEERDNKEA